MIAFIIGEVSLSKITDGTVLIANTECIARKNRKRNTEEKIAHQSRESTMYGRDQKAQSTRELRNEDMRNI